MKSVSVIVPNYNHAPYLEQRIESILKQSFKDFELIILDDCSTDNSKDIIKRYVDNDKVTYVFFNELNSGSPFGLWKYGIQKARGKYIWIAESDDWADEHFLNDLVSILEDSEAVMAHSNSFFYINEEFKLNDWWNSFESCRWNSNYVESGINLLKEYGRFKCPVINVSSAVFRKDILKDEFYPVNYRYSGDWSFWGNVFLEGNIAFISKPLNTIRVHNLSVTQNNKAVNINKLKEDIKVLKTINKKLNIKTSYNHNYAWLIDFWIGVLKNNGKYFSKEHHFVDLPYSFKIAFYKRYTPFIFSKVVKKITK